MVSTELEQEGAGVSSANVGTVPLKTVLMKNTKRTLDMFVGQEGAPPPTFMARRGCASYAADGHSIVVVDAVGLAFFVSPPMYLSNRP